MKTLKKINRVILMVLIFTSQSQAKLSQPDFVLYGTATWFGAPLPNGSEITIYLDSQLLTVAKYSIGMETNLNGLYALRVPMDDVDPRIHGKARPGDSASVFLNGNKVAEILVGAYGKAERLDIDPINLSESSSVINIVNGELAEGNSGSSLLSMQITLSNVSDSEVSVVWSTLDGTAFGQNSCGFDIDYINKSGTAIIAAQTTSTTIEIEICGDTIIEDSETFEVVLSQPSNAIIQFDRATATILDDDGAPELRGFDVVIFEPNNGIIIHEFQLSLSRIYQQDVSFNFTTVSQSATAGTDFTATSGQMTIPAGQQQVVIPVEVLSDTASESIEVFELQISNVSNAQLITPTLTAFIMDSNREQKTKKQNEFDNTTIPELISPSDVVFSADNSHVYVASLAGIGSILHFSFENELGTLNLISSIDNTTIGFEAGMFKLIRQIVMSPNGKYLYAAASADDAISAFSIDSNTGELTLIASIAESFVGEFGIKNVYGLAISSDNKHLYAAGSGTDSVAAFVIDDLTGTLSFIEAETQGVNDPNDSGLTISFMDRPIKLSVSPDGNNVYVAAEFSSSVITFDRDNSTGEINYKQSLKSGIDGISEIGGAAAVLISADGSHVYTVGKADDSIVTFNRIADGTLSFNSALTKSNPDFIGLDSPTGLISSPADDHLYVIGFEDSTMVTFTRKKESTELNFGQLEFADIEQDGVDGINKMNGPTSLAITSDGKWIIVAAGIDNALVVFNTHINVIDLIYRNGFE